MKILYKKEAQESQKQRGNNAQNHGKDMEKGKGSLCLIFSKCLGTFRRFKLKKHFAKRQLRNSRKMHLFCQNFTHSNSKPVFCAILRKY